MSATSAGGSHGELMTATRPASHSAASAASRGREDLGERLVYTHLVSDHYHYWEDGGATYHNRYSSWEFVRGQEWDKWKAMVAPPLERFRAMYHPMQHPQGAADGRTQAMVNREFMREEADFCCPRTFAAGFEFLDRIAAIALQRIANQRVEEDEDGPHEAQSGLMFAAFTTPAHLARSFSR